MGIVLDVRCDVLMLFSNRRLINGGRRQKIVLPKMVAVLITFSSSSCRCTSKVTCYVCLRTECMSDSNGKVTVSYNPSRARLQNTRLLTLNLKRKPRESQSQSVDN